MTPSPFYTERVVGVAVRVYNTFNRLVGYLPELGQYLGRCRVVLTGVDYHYSRIPHRHTGGCELPSHSAVNMVFNRLVYGLRHLPRPHGNIRQRLRQCPGDPVKRTV